MWEDEYDPTNREFPCKVDRTSGPLHPSQQLNLINQNLNVDFMPLGRGLRIPDRLNSPRTNSVYSYVQLFYINARRKLFIDGIVCLESRPTPTIALPSQVTNTPTLFWLTLSILAKLWGPLLNWMVYHTNSTKTIFSSGKQDGYP